MHPNSTGTWLMLVTILLSPLLALAVQQTTVLLIDGRLSLPKMSSGPNAFEINEVQD